MHDLPSRSIVVSRIASLTVIPSPSPLTQYNRRFVNVVVGLGKKRSPNSNAA